MKNKIAIYDFQILSVLGDTPEEIWDHLINKTSCLKELSFSEKENEASMLVGRIELDFKRLLGGKGWRHHNRAALMSCLAGKRLLGSELFEQHWLCRPEKMGLVMGSSTDFFYDDIQAMQKEKTLRFVNPVRVLTLSANVIASLTAIYLKIKAFAMTHPTGYLAGYEALELAAQSLSAGRCEWALAGGAEEIFLNALQSQDENFFGRSDSGEALLLDVGKYQNIPVGEGCALLLCGKAGRNLYPKNNSRALIEGFAMCFNPEPKTPSDPTAACQAIKKILIQAGIRPNQVGAIFLSCNGTASQDEAEARALTEVFGEEMPPAFALKSVIGETFHAAGALSVAIATVCLEKGIVPPNQNLAESQWVDKLNMRDQKRNIQTPYVLVMGMENNYKAGVLILSLPSVG
ncbi:hypothetical protein K8S19_13410 [bacterium]|nr:hypothetical protein [bacterium]